MTRASRPAVAFAQSTAAERRASSSAPPRFRPHRARRVRSEDRHRNERLAVGVWRLACLRGSRYPAMLTLQRPTVSAGPYTCAAYWAPGRRSRGPARPAWLTTGADAACVNAIGAAVLGPSKRPVDPPVVGEYMFHSRAQDPASPCCRSREPARQSRSVHRCELARAIPEGPRSQGRPLSYLIAAFRAQR